jgi:hypothetical protein
LFFRNTFCTDSTTETGTATATPATSKSVATVVG